MLLVVLLVVIHAVILVVLLVVIHAVDHCEVLTRLISLLPPGELFRKCMYTLCLFHASLNERSKVTPLGNVPYVFNTSDLNSTLHTLHTFITTNKTNTSPLALLMDTVVHCNYGGQLHDPNDRKRVKAMFLRFFNPQTLRNSSDNNNGSNSSNGNNGNNGSSSTEATTTAAAAPAEYAPKWLVPPTSTLINGDQYLNYINTTMTPMNHSMGTTSLLHMDVNSHTLVDQQGTQQPSWWVKVNRCQVD